ncbi:MAG: glycine dehydrogenase (aminomethyl-transferring), partial [Myxococcota bacterium]
MTRRLLDRLDTFSRRHIGPSEAEVQAMLAEVGADSLDELIEDAVPPQIRSTTPLQVGRALSETEALAALREMANKNQVARSFIGLGYHGTHTPAVILRNLLENPGWYTQYTPYQAEIAQGRLEALLNFQTMVEDLTGLPVANASLLDEGTAAAEAMAMCRGMVRKGEGFFVADDVHPQTIAVVRTRAEALGVPLHVADASTFDFSSVSLFGALLQTPNTYGHAIDASELVASIQATGAKVAVATDLLALCLMKTPGDMGADIAVGSAQRFGVPMGFGGPHAAFLAARQEHARKLPGRVVGVSKDARGQMALRLAMQTREQHIRREKATSNICTAQVLLANIASMYAVYHGPEGLREIAERVHGAAQILVAGLAKVGVTAETDAFFDTVTFEVPDAAAVMSAARKQGINLREVDSKRVAVALDETVSREDLSALFEVFGSSADLAALEDSAMQFPEALRRSTAYLTHPVFNAH